MTAAQPDEDLGIAPDPYEDPVETYVPEYDDRPTRKQLAYLRVLADRTGQTFAYPRTIAQAGREINRLKAVRASSRQERAIERIDFAAEQAARTANCDVPVDESEISGWGSTATWSQRS